MIKKKVGKKKEIGKYKGMEKDIRILSIGLLILLLVSFFALFITFRITPTGNATLDIFQLGEDVGQDTQIIVAKYIMFLTLMFILYWAFDLMIEKYAIGKFFISAGISWLSFAFIVKGDFLTALTSFSALGIIAMVGLPALGILLINTRLLNLDNINAPKLIVQRVIWGAYSAVLFYLLWTQTNMFSFLTPSVASDKTLGSAGLAWIVFGVFLVSAFLFIFNNVWVKMMVKLQRQVSKLEGVKMELKKDKRKLQAANNNQETLINALSTQVSKVAEEISENTDISHKKWKKYGGLEVFE